MGTTDLHVYIYIYIFFSSVKHRVYLCLMYNHSFFLRAIISFGSSVCSSLFLHPSCPSNTPILWLLQAVPDEEPLPHPAFPPPGATTPLWHCRVLPAAFHGNALLHLLLPGGGLCDRRATPRMKSNGSFFILLMMVSSHVSWWAHGGGVSLGAFSRKENKTITIKEKEKLATGTQTPSPLGKSPEKHI